MRKAILTLQSITCSNLPHKDQFNGKSDPYVEVYWRKGKEGKEDHLIGKTAVIDNEDNPDFPETFYFDNYQKGADQVCNMTEKNFRKMVKFYIQSILYTVVGLQSVRQRLSDQQ